MAVEVRLPRFSEEMTEATVSRWLKHVGDSVDKGEPLVEVETEKVIVEVEAPRAGVILQVVAEEQDVVPVDGVLCRIGQAGEVAKAEVDPVSAVEDSAAGQPAPAETNEVLPSPPEVPPQEAAASLSSSPPSSPRSSPVAETASSHGAAAPSHGAAAPSHSAAAPGASPKTAAPDGNGRQTVTVSPLARRVAQELAIDLTAITGTGIGGKIVMADLQPFLDRQAPEQQRAHPPGPAVSAPASGQAAEDTPSPAQTLDRTSPAAPLPEGGTPIPHSPLRRTIARRLGESKRTIPHFYMTAEIDVTDALSLRKRFNAANEDIRISVNDLIIKAVATALVRVPALNATYGDEAVTRHEAVHVGFATAIEEGLVTPVVRDCHLKSVGRIASETAGLIELARTRRLGMEQMEGGTFTISNLGMYPVVEFSAIINPPQVGILAVARSEDKPVAVNGRLVNRKAMRVTLSADHRAVDGITGAEFLTALKGLLEHPEGLMI